MGSLTIRNLDDELKARLRLRAARHNCSMEAEVRSILGQVLLPDADPGAFAARINQRFASLEAESLPIPARQAVRTPPDFGE
jgi:plasmid stability protein